VTRKTQLALTDWLKGNLTDQLRTRNSPLPVVSQQLSGTENNLPSSTLM